MLELDPKVKSTRNNISKKTRFEVFKRDSFTCQYCGRKSPDVVLQVDHIKPVARGGKNTIMNYVTSCSDCNNGKGARELSDSTAVEKVLEQAKLLQERREQIEMMRDWQLGLVDESLSAVEAVNDLYKKLTNREYVISESYKSKTIAGLVKKYGLADVLDALRSGSESYGDPSKALNKLPGICACRNDPELNRRVHLLNKMQKRFWNFKRQEASIILQRGYRFGGEGFYGDVEEMIFGVTGTWYQVSHHFENLVDRWNDL